MKKFFLIVLCAFLLSACIMAIMLWNKPHRDIAKEKGIVIEATLVSAEYEDDRASADRKYLDKVLEISGVVKDISINQDGKTVIVLDDLLSGVQCTMKDTDVNINLDELVTVKGICNGYTIGVLMSECIFIE